MSEDKTFRKLFGNLDKNQRFPRFSGQAHLARFTVKRKDRQPVQRVALANVRAHLKSSSLACKVF